MEKYICRLRFRCGDSEKCQGAKPHEKGSCNPCGIYNQTVTRCHSGCENEDHGWCVSSEFCDSKESIITGDFFCKKAMGKFSNEQ